ncbi:arginine--tRNA ligase [Candidatus Poribacteria bacterium]|nr:arginine--tRNA ligase [Candidatus Poribacteria bacterium]
MQKNIKENIISKIKESLNLCIENSELSNEILTQPITIETPPDNKFGDLSCTLPMQLARIVKKSPRDIANYIIKNFPRENAEYIKDINIAGAGYINFYLNPICLNDVMRNILDKNHDYGKSTMGQGKKIQVEFVSANPTGPLHIGHGRGAAIGDSLSNILKASGFEVQKEYYINNVGRQMLNLGASTQHHYYKMFGKTIELPENGYRGTYIIEIAQSIKDKYGDKYFTNDPKESLSFFKQYTGDYILDGIKKDLKDFGVAFDIWFSEDSLHQDGTVNKMLQYLKDKGFIYEKDGALWLKSTQFGDDKDRVVISSEGKTTYLASDIAYHYNKFQRGFDKVINIWGADHHGYVPRIKATVQALGHAPDSVNVILYQLVNLLRDGKPVAMSTRTGEFVTLEEVVSEVGKDVARFYFLTRTSGSHLDFDLELAKKQSMENPVFYIQYAHARISSIFAEAAKNGFDLNLLNNINIDFVNKSDEIDIMKKLASYPEVIESSAINYEPHRIIVYLQELAGMFHSYYNKYRVIGEAELVTKNRLILLKCIKIVIKNALNLLGVNVPERM